MEAEVGAHGRADVADLHREQRVLERTGEHAAADPAEIAALRLGAGIGRNLGRHGGKILAVAQPRRDGLGRGPRGVLLPVRDLDQDVASAPLFGVSNRSRSSS